MSENIHLSEGIERKEIIDNRHEIWWMINRLTNLIDARGGRKPNK